MENKTTGKFRTAEELLAAYNALEREFTKRCQLVKQLQAKPDAEDNAAADALEAQEDIEKARDGEAEASRTAAEKLGTDSMPDEPAERAIAAAVSETAANAVQKTVPERPTTQPPEAAPGRDVLDEIAEHADDYAEALSAIPQVMEACIARYKRTLIGVGAGGAACGGMAVIMPAKRPKTLADAKKLADEMLK